MTDRLTDEQVAALRDRRDWLNKRVECDDPEAEALRVILAPYEPDPEPWADLPTGWVLCSDHTGGRRVLRHHGAGECTAWDDGKSTAFQVDAENRHALTTVLGMTEAAK